MRNFFASVQVRLLLMTVGMVSLMGGTAFAQAPPTPAAEAAANSAISSGVSTATNIVTNNIPLILGVVVLFVALRFGRKLLSKVG